MKLFAELKRRNVIRMGGLYLVGAWLLIQIAETLLPAFDVPGWVLRAIIIVLALGFLPALVFSWVYELTPEGLKRDAEVDPARSIAPQTAQRMDRLILAGLAAVIVVVAADRFWPRANAPDETPAVGSTTSAPAETAVQQAPDVINRSIAVLPFVNMSADPEQEYFSDGLSEEILNLLAQIRELKVSGRTSSFSFKGKDTPIPEIGQLLGVAHVLEGSVRKSGDRLRITAQLIETASGFHLWSETYDREMQDIFVIQTEIAGSISQALKMSLLGPDQAAPVAQKVASLPAYDLFLQARRLIQGRTRSELEAARGLLDEALALDPDYAAAQAAKAQTVLLLNDGVAGYGDIPLDEAVAIAQPLLDRALTLDPELADAHAVQGLLYAEVRRDYLRAEAALTRALALNPNLPDALHWRAGVLGNTGRLREQLLARRKLADLDPLNVANLSALPWNLLDAGEPAEAEAVALRLQRAFPDNPQGFAAQAGALINAGRLAEASVPAARALSLAPEGALGRTLNSWLYYALGDFERVLALRTVRVHDLALIALGRIDEAVVAARERSKAAPGDPGAAITWLFTLSKAGRHDEVLALYRERWGDLQGLGAQFGPGESGVQEPIAVAQKALGEQQALAGTLAHWRARLDFKREQGHAGRDFRMTEARYLALAGERAAALTALTAAIDLGTRDPLLGHDPAFAELQADPAFQAQIRRMIELINLERAKLDMAPLP
jgi:TolB-like protein/Tfp pilus assembly protein PilF